MKQYLDLLQAIKDGGNFRGDRTGTGTQSLFGYQFRHDLSKGFPLLTTKKMAWKPIVTELLWFIRGDTNIKYLLENDCHIWTADAYRVYKRKCTGDFERSMEEFESAILSYPEFAKQWGDLGPVYGAQWRQWCGYVDANDSTSPIVIDQLKEVINDIKSNPESRRHIVTAWNPAEIGNMALPPCHLLYQFYVHDGKLSCHMYQRSADVFLGVPFNIASYALLTHIVAQQTGLDVGDLIISFGDVHIYNNHRDVVDEQLSRTPRELPQLVMSEVGDPDGSWRAPRLEEYKLIDFGLIGYNPHDSIKAELSVGV